MSYNPSLYNPYGSQQYQPMSTQNMNWSYQPTVTHVQPVNGLIKVTGIEGAQMYQLPPGSVSPPLFVEDENAFFIKTTDDGGAAAIKKYRFEEAPMTAQNQGDFVTREYFDQKMQAIMEAINGKHPVPEQSETQGQ